MENFGGFNLPARGRTAAPLHIEVVRELTLEDIPALASTPKIGGPLLQKLRSIHHTTAKLVAQGLNNIQVAAATGYTPERVSQLLADPAFQQLAAMYQDEAISVHIDETRRVAGKLLNAAETALDEINERLDDDVKRRAMPVSELRQVTQLGLDRTVAPPKATNAIPPTPVTVTLDFGGKGFIDKKIDKPPSHDIIDQPPQAPKP